MYSQESIEQNKQIVEKFLNDTHSGSFDVIDELVSENIVTHGFPCANPKSREDYKAFFSMLDEAFPDMEFGINTMLGESDKIAVHFFVKGTHSNEFMGIARTGRKVSFTGMVIYRLENGQIAETWLQPDNATLLQQLGVIAA